MTKQERAAAGQRLRRQRNCLGLTREQFAELADIGAGYYGQIEVGTSQMSIDTLIKVPEPPGCPWSTSSSVRREGNGISHPCKFSWTAVPPASCAWRRKCYSSSFSGETAESLPRAKKGGPQKRAALACGEARTRETPLVSGWRKHIFASLRKFSSERNPSRVPLITLFLPVSEGFTAF